MKKAKRTSIPAKLVLRRESLVVLGVTELREVAGGGSRLSTCPTTAPGTDDTSTTAG